MLSEPQIQRPHARRDPPPRRGWGGGRSCWVARGCACPGGRVHSSAAARTYLGPVAPRSMPSRTRLPGPRSAAPLLEGLPGVELEDGHRGAVARAAVRHGGDARGCDRAPGRQGAEASPGPPPRAATSEPPGPAEPRGPGAVVAGGALALLVQRRLLGLAAPLRRRSARRLRWRWWCAASLRGARTGPRAGPGRPRRGARPPPAPRSPRRGMRGAARR